MFPCMTMASSLTVFLHTDLPISHGETLADARTVTGWANISSVAALRAHWQQQTRVTRNLDQTFKYAWLVQAGQQQPAVEPWMLTDTDVIVQCSASEVAQRFADFHVPLVVAAERWLFPQPMPYGTLRHELIRRTFPRYPATGMRYPNSGVLLGTRAGFELLLRTLQALHNFPCCRWWPASSGECIVDDQGCLHAALQRMRRGIDYELDQQARLFLSMYLVRKHEVNVSDADGRVRFVPAAAWSGAASRKPANPPGHDESSGRTRADGPCILHFNGVKGGERLELATRARGATWVPRMTASLRGGRTNRRT